MYKDNEMNGSSTLTAEASLVQPAGAKKTNMFVEKEKKKNVKTMLKRRFSFSLKKTRSASKRALTPMRRRSSKAESLTSLESSSLELLDDEHNRTVRFAREGRSKTKVKSEVRKFTKASEEEAQFLWYTEADMLGIIEDVKVIVRHYHRRCDRYKAVMDRVHMHCGAASVQTDSITSQMDSRVLEQLANADARGLEHHILAGSEGDTRRKDIIQQIIRCQDDHYQSTSEQREQAIADKYAALTHSAKLLAKTMGDGDAFVANSVASTGISMVVKTNKNNTTYAPSAVAIVAA